jgi:enoyl-CoA hydratase
MLGSKMNYKNIKFEIKEGYALITLNRPDKLNALNYEVFSELDSAVNQIELNDEINLLIITGEGEKAFAAGADIKELHQSDKNSGLHFSQHGTNVMNRIENLKIPVIAAVNGFALGGGCELAMACHMRFASDNAKFGQPEVNLGIIPGYGGTQRLPKLVGKAKAMELILTGNMIAADEAKSLGLVNEVFPQSELYQKVEEIAKLILLKSIPAIKASVQTVSISDRVSLREGIEYESEKFAETCGTDDFKEGTLAFIEKRKPKFTGK